MNINDYSKPVYCCTKYNTKIYFCDIYNIPKNFCFPSNYNYKWLNEREIMKIENCNAILKSFFKGNIKNTKNTKNTKKVKNVKKIEYDELKPTIQLEKHDYESIRSFIEKHEKECDCDYQTVQSVIDFLELEKDYNNKFKYNEYDCETVQSVIDFLELEKDYDNKFEYNEYDCETVQSVVDFLEL